MRDMLAVDMLAHDGSVLGFGQTVVLAMPGARLGGAGYTDTHRERGIAMGGIGAQDRAFGGRSGEGVMQGISLCEELHVSDGEIARKARRRAVIALDELLPLKRRLTSRFMCARV